MRTETIHLLRAYEALKPLVARYDDTKLKVQFRVMIDCVRDLMRKEIADNTKEHTHTFFEDCQGEPFMIAKRQLRALALRAYSREVQERVKAGTLNNDKAYVAVSTEHDYNDIYLYIPATNGLVAVTEIEDIVTTLKFLTQ